MNFHKPNLHHPKEAPQGRARPLDIWRDLEQVADLLEVAFAERLDHEGKHLLRNLRRAAHDTRFLRWVARQDEVEGLPLLGYVWEDEGRLVGNVSLVLFRVRGRRHYIIANVAVHPAYRRRGIAHALMKHALTYVQRRRGQAWLYVESDNTGALALYQRLGFRTVAQRAIWQAPNPPPTPPPAPYQVDAVRCRDAAQQQAWLRAAYPATLAWFAPLQPPDLHPGWRGWWRRLRRATTIRQCGVRHQGRFLLGLAWAPGNGATDSLFLAAPTEGPDAAALALAWASLARHIRHPRPTLLEFPAEANPAPFEAAGFTLQRRLLWMHWKPNAR